MLPMSQYSNSATKYVFVIENGQNSARFKLTNMKEEKKRKARKNVKEPPSGKKKIHETQCCKK